MATSVAEMAALVSEIGRLERDVGLPVGQIGIVPVCETALGVADVRLIVKGSPRITMALLGAEDLAADLQAERSREGYELDYARRRFVFECRAAGLEPIDAPYTFADVEGLSDGARGSKRLGTSRNRLFGPNMLSRSIRF